jgi:hypothetical protein
MNQNNKTKQRYIVLGSICWALFIVVLALKDVLPLAFLMICLLVVSVLGLRYWVMAIRGY